MGSSSFGLLMIERCFLSLALSVFLASFLVHYKVKQLGTLQLLHFTFSNFIMSQRDFYRHGLQNSATYNAYNNIATYNNSNSLLISTSVASSTAQNIMIF